MGTVVTWLMLVGLVWGVGCAESLQPREERSSPERSYRVVSTGKADNYFSESADEYIFHGTINDLELTEAEVDDPMLRKRAVSARTTMIATYLTAYMRRRLPELLGNSNPIRRGHMSAMVRNQSMEARDLVHLGGNQYKVDYSIEFAGPENLLERMVDQGVATTTEDGLTTFSFQMPEGAEESDGPGLDGAVDRLTVKNFSPEEFDGELETVWLEGRRYPDMPNSYPHYRDFFRDGVYDLTLYVGYDYGEDRSDIPAARRAFERLKSWSFSAPVDSFSELEADSGPFVRTIQVPAPKRESPRRIRVEIRLFHAEMFGNGSEQHARHRKRAKRELRERDVFIYSGHGKAYYGFDLTSRRADEIPYTDFEDIELAEKQQLFIAHGCKTYSQYADALYANPAKSEKNLDVVTTINEVPWRRSGVLETVENLVETEDGRHRPHSFGSLLEDLNEKWANSFVGSFFGVIGIDRENPQLHPQANVDAVGRSCEAASDCGVPAAHYCLENRCAASVLREGGGCPGSTEKVLLVEESEGDEPNVVGAACRNRDPS